MFRRKIPRVTNGIAKTNTTLGLRTNTAFIRGARCLAPSTVVLTANQPVSPHTDTERGGLTKSGGVYHRGEEDGNEKPQFDHDDAGEVGVLKGNPPSLLYLPPLFL